MTTKHEVINLHRANPTLTAAQIAAALGCGVEYVRATARRNGLTLKSAYPPHDDPRTLRATARQLMYRAQKLIDRATTIEGRK